LVSIVPVTVTVVPAGPLLGLKPVISVAATTAGRPIDTTTSERSINRTTGVARHLLPDRHDGNIPSVTGLRLLIESLLVLPTGALREASPS
jgi:hypothetical protein